MKELSIEEKAKAYDKALEKARQLCAYPTTKPFIRDLQDIFPELKESEDERIRKAMIKYFTNGKEYLSLTPYSREDYIAWLEKQGEQKIKSKFHEGDWIITNKNHIWYIDETPETTSYLYRLINQYGKVEVAEFEVVDETARLWTIQDAKDGDVLINTNVKYPFIFKQLKPSDIKTDIKNPLTILGYCGIGGTGFTKSEGCGDTANCIYYPATKEQRDTLMKEMADAGYTFDFEKKELKKIEQKSTEWSEEDDKYKNIVVSALNNPSIEGLYIYHKVNRSDIINWFRLLKDRVKSQPQWKPSEAQLVELYYASNGVHYNRATLLNLLEQLKKLREE